MAKADTAGAVFNEYKWHPSEIAMVGGGVPEDKGGMLGWDLSGCNFGTTQLTTNINAFFKKARQKISSNRYIQLNIIIKEN